MVQAILEGRKTQTRRIMKPQPPEWIDNMGYTAFTPSGHISGRGYWKGVPGDEGLGEKFFKLKYGSVGDLLWVRETISTEDADRKFIYKANELDINDPFDYSIVRWKPSIHMPKAAARIWLEVLSVGVERIKDITDADAIAEGMLDISFPAPRYQFIDAWKEIYGENAWFIDPWVYVVEFKVV